MSRAEHKKHFNAGKRLAQKKKFREAIGEFEQALKLKPKDIDTIFQLGNMAREMHLYDVAIKWFDIILSMDPTQVQVQFNRASALKLAGRNDEALVAYQILLHSMSDNHMFLNNYGTLLMQMGRSKEAIPLFEKATSLVRQNGEYKVNLALAWTGVGRWKDALDVLLSALPLMKKDPVFHINLANVYFHLGLLEEAWEHYEWRHTAGYKEAINYAHDIPWWRGEDLTGKTILLSPEQGIGDQVIFSSCVQEIVGMAEHVILECTPKVLSMMKRSIPEVECRLVDFASADMKLTYRYDWIKKEDKNIDYFSPIGNALAQVRRKVEDFPLGSKYLSVSPELREVMRIKLAEYRKDNLKLVGFSWRSGYMSGARNISYLSVEKLVEQINAIEGEFICVNLQYSLVEDEVNYIKAHCKKPFLFIDGVDLFNDLEATLALMANLDAAVSVRNLQLSLASGIGVPVLALGGGQLTFGEVGWDPMNVNSMIVGPEQWPDYFLDFLENPKATLKNYLASINHLRRPTSMNHPWLVG